MGFTVIFGLVFVDVKGFSFGKYNPSGRNVGDVKIVHGGVARNVAENLANIGQPVSLVTMFEPNALGEEARRRLAARGVDLKYAETVPAGMGMWLAVMDENGDLAGSISRQPDVGAMEKILCARGSEIISACENIVLEIDMNDSIAERVFALAEKYHKDIYAIVANMSVISRHPELLKKTRLFIMNEIEAGILFGRNLENVDPEEMRAAVIEGANRLGIREIVVTMGARGAVYFDASAGMSGTIPPQKVRMVDSTGAGDAFFSGTIAARMRGYSLEAAAQMGTALAAATIQSSESTCPRVENFFEKRQEAVV